jgi:hypothetical protein
LTWNALRLSRLKPNRASLKLAEEKIWVSLMTACFDRLIVQAGSVVRDRGRRQETGLGEIVFRLAVADPGRIVIGEAMVDLEVPVVGGGDADRIVKEVVGLARQVRQGININEVLAYRIDAGNGNDVSGKGLAGEICATGGGG